MITDPRLELKLFLEDMQCSVISANVTTAVRMSATVTVLATKLVRELKPMTNVIIGYRDVAGNKPGIVSHDQDDVTYSVLFVGMLTGLTLSRTPDNRTATLQCEGHQSLLDRHYTYISNTSNDLVSHNRSFYGASAAFLKSDLGAAGMGNQINDVFNSDVPPVTPGLETLSGPPKGIIKLIEKCIGVTLPFDSSHIGGDHAHGAQHEFFAHASRQCRLLYQIGGISTDDSILGILEDDNANQLVRNAANQLSNITTLNTIIDILLKKMYYNFVAIGAPSPHQTTSTGEGIQKTQKLNTLLEKYFTDVQEHMKENVGSAYYNIVNFEYLTSVINASSEANIKTEFAKLLESDKKVPSEAFRKELDSIGFTPADRTIINGHIVDTFTKILISYRKNEALDEGKASEYRKSIRNLLRQVASKIPVSTDSAASNPFMRVISYLTIPDLSFSTPPACNVLFPSQISSFSINIPRYNMPTRLLLHAGTVPGSDAAGSVRGYYAPSSGSLSDHQGGVARENHAIPLFKHERFTGVVPSFASFSFYEKNKVNRLVRDDDHNTMLRVANYNLVRQRYQPVTLSVSGPFNPFPAVGFPMAVMDIDDITNSSPTIYIGLLSNISHSYDSGGSSMTSYSMTHVREIDEIDDIFSDSSIRVRTGQHQKVEVTSALDFSGKADAIKEAFMQFAISQQGKSLVIEPFGPNSSGSVQAFAHAIHKTKKLGTHIIRVAGENKSVVDFVRAPSRLSGNEVRAIDWGNSIRAGTPANVNKQWWQDQLLPIVTGSDDQFASRLSQIFKDEPLHTELHLLVGYWQNFLGSILKRVGNPSSGIKAMYEPQINLCNDLFKVAGFFDLRLDNENHYTKVFGGLTIAQLLKRSFEPRPTNPVSTSTTTIHILQLALINPKRLREQIEAGKGRFFGGSVEVGADVFEKAFLYVDTSADTQVNPSSSSTAQPTALSNIALEEVYRPPWTGDSYSIKNIGRDLYYPTLFIGSVQDRVADNDFDTSVNEDNSVAPTHSTKKSLIHAFRGYIRQPTSELRDRYVSTYVRRPIAHILDVIEEFGLLKTKIAVPLVVDTNRECPPEAASDSSHAVGTTSSMTVDGAAIVSEKREAVMSYIASTQGDAFR